MASEKKNQTILKKLNPKLNDGEYVFCSVDNIEKIDCNKILGSFKEKEGISIIISKKEAVNLRLSFSFIAAWITLTVSSTLEDVGLTAAFSNALNKNGISCNVISGYYHDHIFVNINDKDKAMNILKNLSAN
tara:strand:- start:23 stop:418 length:396 start_codon:yes stop_codon:yes gene_type:complete